MDELEKTNEWEANHVVVLDAYSDYVEEHGKAPKITDLAKTTQLSRPTIYKHLRKMQLIDVSDKFRIRALTILEGVAKKAEEGDVAAAKLILQLSFGWNEKKIVENQNTNRSIKVVFTNPTNDDLKKITDTKYEDVSND